MKIELINDNGRTKSVNMGYDFIFLLTLLFGFLILPFCLYTIYRKQYVEMVSAYVILYLVNTFLIGAFYATGGQFSIFLILNFITLFITLYLYPLYLPIWQCKKLYQEGFRPDDHNSEVATAKFYENVENNTIFGSIYRKNKKESYGQN